MRLWIRYIKARSEDFKSFEMLINGMPYELQAKYQGSIASVPHGEFFKNQFVTINDAINEEY